jgi:hypothetical protein
MGVLMSDDDQADRNEAAMREVMRQEQRRQRQEQAAANRAQGYARDHRDGGRNR